MKKFYKLICIIYIFIFSGIFWGGLFFNQSQIRNADFFPLFISTTFFLILWIFLFKLYSKKGKEISSKKEKFLFFFFSIIIILLGCFYGYFLLSDGEGWDMYVILRASKDIANNSLLHYDDNIYFQVISVNRFLVVYLACFYKILNIFNITNQYLPHIITNIVSIYVSFVCMYFIIRKLYDKKIAIFMYASCIFLTPIFLYVPIAYTDIISMPFILISIFLYLNFKSCQNIRNKIILTILLCFTIFIGSLFKMTVIFIGFGMLFDIILNKKFKESLVYMFLSIFIIIILMNIYPILLNKSKLFPFDVTNNQYTMPYQLYILYGIDEKESDYDEGKTWYGVWNQKDLLYVLMGDPNYQDGWVEKNSVKMYLYEKSPYSYEKKEELATELLFKKFQEYGLTGLIKHLYFKSIFTFADGTYYIPLKVSLDPVQKENIFLDIFTIEGKYFTIYFYIAQGIHMTILLLSIYCVYLNYKDNNKKDILFTVPLLCLFLLLLIWETRSRYVLNYSLLLYMLVATFFQKLSLQNNK